MNKDNEKEIIERIEIFLKVYEKPENEIKLTTVEKFVFINMKEQYKFYKIMDDDNGKSNYFKILRYLYKSIGDVLFYDMKNHRIGFDEYFGSHELDNYNSKKSWYLKHDDNFILKILETISGIKNKDYEKKDKNKEYKS